jgi:SAM-dependent methyltransferase
VTVETGEQGMDTPDAEFWDQWWQDRVSRGHAETFPLLPAPLVEFRGRVFDVANSDALLAIVMAEHGLRTVLCAGNGVSQEPRALAEVGLDVTALDISPVATRFAETFQDPRGLPFFGVSQMSRPGGRVQFVVGDLLDPAVCPGPFDVVIERRTVQVLAEHLRGDALSALSRRLGEPGIFLSLCLDDPFAHDLGWSQHKSGLFHASQSWFEERDWGIWDEVPSSTLEGRVAWLLRAGSMKGPPREESLE